MRTKSILAILILMGASLTLVACSESTAQKPLNKTAVNVEVTVIKEITGKQEISYSGTIEESESVSLSFAVLGRISKVLISEGDMVQEGQLLAELDDQIYRSTYEMAQAALAQAEDADKRLTPMYKNGNLPEIKYVEIQTGLLKAKAAVAIARKNLDECMLLSPTSGIVGRCSMDQGMNALPNVVSIDIVKIQKVYALVAVSENEIDSINLGQKAVIAVGALGDERHEGVVEKIGVMANPLSHTYKIKIGFENSSRQIKPGMICNVVLAQNGPTTRVCVPIRAVLVDETGSNFVYVVKDDKAVKQHIETGRILKTGIEITKGLSVGAHVVVTGQQKLVDQSLVHVINR